MKILPIQNFNYATSQRNYAQKNSQPNFLVNKQLSSDVVVLHKNTNNSRISFGNIQRALIPLEKRIPLEDKIASLFDVFKRGDIITVGKNVKETQKALQHSLDSLDHVIKRVFFIKDENLDGSIAIFKNATGEKEVLNINDFDLYLTNSSGQGPIKPNDSLYIVEDDIIHINDREIPIKETSQPELSSKRHLFSKVFDFSNDSISVIKRQNAKELATIFMEKKGKNQPLSFADVGGQDKVLEKLKKGVLYPIQYPDAFENQKVNHGIILTGPPGTGKTLIAEALANESNAYFAKLNGSELKSKWHGESESNLKNFFDEAVQNQPSILVFDEFDSIAKKRENLDEHNAEFLNQFLSIMSDIEKRGDEVFVLATTNKIELLDDAIMRSGRFGKHIEVGPPDLKGTRQILDIHTKNKQLAKDLDLDKLAKKLYEIKATGADIARLTTDANNNAFERLNIFDKMEKGTFKKSDLNDLKITEEDFDLAIKDFLEENTIKNQEPKKIGFK